MSELSDRYARRAVADWVSPPPFAELQGRARRRVHRLRAVRVAGGAVIAALVAVPLMTMPGDRGDDPLAPEFPDDFYGTGGVGFTVEFYDPSHGYATYTGTSCNTAWLSVTRDGGVTWSELREVPGTRKYPAPEGLRSEGPGSGWVCADAWLIPVSTETLIALVGTSTLAGREWVDPPTSAFISHDAGESWREYQPEVRTADTVPDEVTVGTHCEDDACKEAGVGWYDPRTGDRLVLRDSPAVTPGYARHPATAADGSIWVTGADGDGDFQVWVSEDRGRSWQDRSPDEAGTIHPGTGDAPYGSAALATGDGETAYLWAPESTGPATTGALYRTTDRGEAWQRLPATQPFAAVDNLRVAPDGTLVVGELGGGTQYVSSDQGETFHSTDQPLWDVKPLAIGWFGWAPDDSADRPIDGYVSEDGLTWQPVRAPRP